MLNKKIILGVGVTNDTLDNILKYIIENLQKSRNKFYVVTPNAELLVIANKNKSYKEILNQAEIASPDSVGLMIGARLEGKTLKERIHGVDLMENLCKEIAKRPITVGFLGGGPRVAEKVAERLKAKYPGLKVIFAIEEWPQNDQELICDLLFVAFGSPKQEFWIAENFPKINVKAAMGVGGAFDFVSGRVPRAPKYIRKIGFEWLFRLIIQPWRIKRQTALIKFVVLVIKEKIF